MKKLFFSIFVLIFFTGLASAQSEMEPELVKAFADSLFEEGFLTEAEGEYKRYLFLSPASDSFKDSLPFQDSLLSLCNIYKVQQNKSGAQWLDKHFYNQANKDLKQKIGLLNTGFAFTERKLSDFQTFSTKILSDQNNFSPDFCSLLRVSDLLLNNNIEELKIQLPLLAQGSSLFTNLASLGSSYKKKSPGLALFLSSILPGSGKWYTGSFGAFASSFISISSFVTGTVLTGIESSWKSWQPYVFGSCALILYISDLYGAYKSAQRYNDALYRHLCEETEKLYDQLY